mgnify:CR=1 FL=1
MPDAQRERGLRVAILVNAYPGVSHSFIRREIAALEALGLAVVRVSIRPQAAASLADPDDRAELTRTRVLLAGGARGVAVLLGALASAAVRSPRALGRAAREAVALGRGSERGVALHLAYLAEACVLRRLLADAGVAHVHAHFGTNSAAVALLCHALGGPPFSFTAHGTESFDRPDLVKLRHKVERARFAVAVCEYGRERILRAAGAGHAGRVHVVRCGLDGAFLEPAPAPIPDRRRLVCVARLAPEKGLPVLLEAAERLVKEDAEFELVLVGDGPLRGMLEATTARGALAGRVRFTGALGAEAVRAEIRAARLLVLPSLAEGLPVVLMEALALGRPVVATRVGGVAELVEPGANGWLVEPGSAEALAGALREALAAPPERLADMGRHGRARVRARHDAHREAQRLAALFAGGEGA